MINGIGPTGAGRIDSVRADALQRGAPAAKIAPVASEASESAAPNPAAELASSGPPIDAQKIAAIRTAIAEGRYPIDPQAIADKMIELDLPSKP